MSNFGGAGGDTSEDSQTWLSWTGLPVVHLGKVISAEDVRTLEDD